MCLPANAQLRQKLSGSVPKSVFFLPQESVAAQRGSTPSGELAGGSKAVLSTSAPTSQQLTPLQTQQHGFAHVTIAQGPVAGSGFGVGRGRPLAPPPPC